MSQAATVTRIVKTLLSSMTTTTASSGVRCVAQASSGTPALLGVGVGRAPLVRLGRCRGLLQGSARSANFATSVSKRTPTTLGEILSEELKTEETLYYRDEILDSVPAGFELIQSDGDSSMELNAEHKNESISVVFSITEFRTDDADFADFDDMEEDDEGGEAGGEEAGEYDEDDDDEYEEEPEPSIDFNVHVTKGEETLTFECTTDGSIYTINTVNMSRENTPMERLEYEGPNFDDLEENLQEGFFEYLHERGVDYEFARFLFTVAIDKEQREYMNWLKDIKGFVSK